MRDPATNKQRTTIFTSTAAAAAVLAIQLLQPASAAITTSPKPIMPVCGSDPANPIMVNCKTFAPVNDSAIMFGWNVNLNWDRTDAVMGRLLTYVKPPAVFGIFTKIGNQLYGQAWDKPYKVDYDDMLDQIKGRNAILLTSLDPFDTYDTITADAIQQFAGKMKMFNDNGIPVIIRPAHEMNGPWYSYGQQPTKFKKFYKDVYNAVKAVAPLTAFMFAPNLGNGYPWTIGEYHIKPTDPDFPLCDTNKNGKLDEGDDPYTPYYPGDDVVDWFGVSVYWKGSSYPYVRNDRVDSNVIYNQMTAVLGGGTSTLQFAESRKLPIAFPEMGGSYSPDFPGVSNLETKQGMWQQTFSPAAKSRMPSLKLASWFDYYKYEDDGWRDFTISNASSISTLGPALASDLNSYPNILYAANVSGKASTESFPCGCFAYTDSTDTGSKAAGGTPSDPSPSASPSPKKNGAVAFGYAARVMGALVGGSAILAFLL